MKNHFLLILALISLSFAVLFVPKTYAEESKILTAYIETWLETNARDAGTSDNVTTVGQTWVMDFALPENYTFELLTNGVKSIEGNGYKGSMTDSTIRLEKGFYKSDFLTFNLAASYLAPTSEKSRDVYHMNWGLQIRPTFIFTLFKEGEMSLKFRTRPTYNEYSYSQDYDSNNFYNIQRTFVWANRLHFDVNSWMYAQLYATYITKWNTNGDHINDEWELEQCLGFTINPNYYLEFYHSSSNPFYSKDGQRNDQDIFDNDISTYKVLLGFTF